MAELVENKTAEEESTFHSYTGNAIPWYRPRDLDPFLVRRDCLRGDLAAAGHAVRATQTAMTSPLPRELICDYCKLPLPVSWRRTSTSGSTPPR